MPFTDQEYFEVIEKNEIVKKAFENIKQICTDLQKQTNCPQEDLLMKERSIDLSYMNNNLKRKQLWIIWVVLFFISKQWNK